MNSSESGCHNTVTSQADEAFFKYDLGQNPTRIQPQQTAFIETCLQHDLGPTEATNQPLCNHFSLKYTFHIISHYKFTKRGQTVFFFSTIVSFCYNK